MIDKQVDVKIGDKTYALIPTLSALVKVCRAFGSPREAMDRVRMGDFDVICGVIIAGADINQKQVEKLREDVFMAGVVNMIVPITNYVAVLMNPTDEEAPEEGKP